MVRNHVEEKREKASMVINFQTKIILSFMVIIFLAMLPISVEFKKSLGPRKWLQKSDTYNENEGKKVSLITFNAP